MGIAASLWLLGLLATTAWAAAPKEIDAQQLKGMMDAGEVQVIFPLSAIEFNNIHISQSVNIPLAELKDRLPTDRDQKLAFYCLGRTWTAAPKAASLAAKQGYSQVFVFRDGLPGWIAAGFPVTVIEKLPKVTVPTISPGELQAMLAAQEDIVLLDLRQPFEAQKFWIDMPNRLVIPLSQLPEQVLSLPAGKKIVILDLNGKRSPVAGRYLYGKGFTDLAKVSGGIHQWVKDGYAVSMVK